VTADHEVVLVVETDEERARRRARNARKRERKQPIVLAERVRGKGGPPDGPKLLLDGQGVIVSRSARRRAAALADRRPVKTRNGGRRSNARREWLDATARRNQEERKRWAHQRETYITWEDDPKTGLPIASVRTLWTVQRAPGVEPHDTRGER
jgi:hypothetical protein